MAITVAVLVLLNLLAVGIILRLLRRPKGYARTVDEIKSRLPGPVSRGQVVEVTPAEFQALAGRAGRHRRIQSYREHFRKEGRDGQAHQRTT